MGLRKTDMEAPWTSLSRESNGSYLPNYQWKYGTDLSGTRESSEASARATFPGSKDQIRWIFQRHEGQLWSLLRPDALRRSSWKRNGRRVLEEGFTREQMKYWGIKTNTGMREFRKKLVAREEWVREVPRDPAARAHHQ